MAPITWTYVKNTDVTNREASEKEILAQSE